MSTNSQPRRQRKPRQPRKPKIQVTVSSPPAQTGGQGRSANKSNSLDLSRLVANKPLAISKGEFNHRANKYKSEFIIDTAAGEFVAQAQDPMNYPPAPPFNLMSPYAAYQNKITRDVRFDADKMSMTIMQPSITNTLLTTAGATTTAALGVSGSNNAMVINTFVPSNDSDVATVFAKGLLMSNTASLFAVGKSAPTPGFYYPIEPLSNISSGNFFVKFNSTGVPKGLQCRLRVIDNAGTQVFVTQGNTDSNNQLTLSSTAQLNANTLYWFSIDYQLNARQNCTVQAEVYAASATTIHLPNIKENLVAISTPKTDNKQYFISGMSVLHTNTSSLTDNGGEIIQAQVKPGIVNWNVNNTDLWSALSEQPIDKLTVPFRTGSYGAYRYNQLTDMDFHVSGHDPYLLDKSITLIKAAKDDQSMLITFCTNVLHIGDSVGYNYLYPPFVPTASKAMYCYAHMVVCAQNENHLERIRRYARNMLSFFKAHKSQFIKAGKIGLNIGKALAPLII